MPTPKTLFRPHILRSIPRLQPLTQHRTFLPNSFTAFSSPSEPQLLTATSTLPYPSAPIYSIIADVPSYATFLPYCQRSDITKWSAPDRTWRRRWPSEGILTSGFGGITESFKSRVYCVPGKIVESVCGDAGTSLGREEIGHHLQGAREQDVQSWDTKQGSGGLLSHLRSKWIIEPVSRDKTNVTLAVEFAFTNPFYAALSGGAAPRVAESMIRAFEKRVAELLEGHPEMIDASLAELDGSRLRRK